MRLKTNHRLMVICAYKAFLASALSLLFPSTSLAQEDSVDNEVFELSPFEVSGKSDIGYRATRSVGATRIAQELTKIPLDIAVVNQEMIGDLAAHDLNEAMNYTSGITPSSFERNRFNIRGFESQRTFDDGAQVPFVMPRETILWERVELLKGPAAILYGTTQPGGAINTVAKKPLSETKRTATFEFANWERLRFGIDLTGPIPIEGLSDQLFYRYIGLYDEFDTHRAFEHFMRRLHSFQLKYAPSNRFDTTFTIRTINDDDDSEAGLVVWNYDRSEVAHGPAFNYRALGEETKDSALYAIETNARFSDRLSMRINASWATARNREWRLQRDSDRVLGSSPELNHLLAVRDEDIWDDETEVNVQVDFNYNYMIGENKSNLVVGYKYRRFLEDRFTWLTRDIYDPDAIVNPLGPTINDPEHPFFGEVRRNVIDLNDRSTWGAVTRLEDGLIRQDKYINNRRNTQNVANSVYLINIMNFMDEKITLMTGVRAADFGGWNRNGTYARDSDPRRALPLPSVRNNFTGSLDPHYVPSVGVIFEAAPGIRPFINYGESFRANNDRIVSGQLYAFSESPEEGQTLDVGIKFDNVLDGKGAGTITLFDIEKSNIVRTDPDTTIPELSGVEASQGIDTEFSYVPSDNVRMQFNYTYLDAETKSRVDRPAEVGAPLPGSPEHLFSFWTRYDFTEGNAKGLSLMGGVRYQTGIRPNFSGNFINTLTPDETVVDLAAAYRTTIGENNWTFRLNFLNVTDEVVFRARRLDYPQKWTFKAVVDF